MVRVLRHLADRDRPVVFVAFGGQAADALAAAGIDDGSSAQVAYVLREHPAFADPVFALENPFLAANRHLEAMGVAPVSW